MPSLKTCPSSACPSVVCTLLRTAAAGALRGIGDPSVRTNCTRPVISWAVSSKAGMPLAGLPWRRKAARSASLRAAICAVMLGPDSPPVALPPWHRAQRLSYRLRPASGFCARATPRAKTQLTDKRSIRIFARYQLPGLMSLTRSPRFYSLVPMRILCSVLLAAAMLPALRAQAGKTAANKAPDNPADWPMYTRDLAGTRYSPLAQINTGNVSKLAPAWTYRLRSAAPTPAPPPSEAPPQDGGGAPAPAGRSG